MHPQIYVKRILYLDPASWQSGWNENQNTQWQNYYQEPQPPERTGKSNGRSLNYSLLNYFPTSASTGKKNLVFDAVLSVQECL